MRCRVACAAGGVHRDHLGGGERVGEVQPLGAELALGVRLGRLGDVDDPLGQRPDELGVAAADPTQPDDRERRVAELLAEEVAGIPAGPAPRAQSSSASLIRRAAAKVRASANSAVASVSTPGVLVTITPRAPAGAEIDVVVPDGEVGDQAQRVAGGVEQLGVDGTAGSATIAARPGASSSSRRRSASGPPAADLGPAPSRWSPAGGRPRAIRTRRDRGVWPWSARRAGRRRGSRTGPRAAAGRPRAATLLLLLLLDQLLLLVGLLE